MWVFNVINHPMIGRGGPFFVGNGKKLSLQTKFLAVDSSLGHFSMKKHNKGRVLGGNTLLPPLSKL